MPKRESYVSKEPQDRPACVGTTNKAVAERFDPGLESTDTVD